MYIRYIWLEFLLVFRYYRIQSRSAQNLSFILAAGYSNCYFRSSFYDDCCGENNIYLFCFNILPDIRYIRHRTPFFSSRAHPSPPHCTILWRCSRKFQMKSIINLLLQFPHRVHSIFALSHVLFIIVLCAAPFSLHFSVFLPHVLTHFWLQHVSAVHFSTVIIYGCCCCCFFWTSMCAFGHKNVGNKFLVRINY